MITTLPAYFLDGNTNLGTVQLNRNSLTTIAPNAFCCGAPVTSLGKSLAKILAATAGLAALLWLALPLCTAWLHGTVIQQSAALGALMVAGGLFYCAVLQLLKLGEMNILISIFRRKFFGR